MVSFIEMLDQIEVGNLEIRQSLMVESKFVTKFYILCYLNHF